MWHRHTCTSECYNFMDQFAVPNINDIIQAIHASSGSLFIVKNLRVLRIYFLQLLNGKYLSENGLYCSNVGLKHCMGTVCLNENLRYEILLGEK